MIRTMIWFIQFWYYQLYALTLWPKIKKVTKTKGARSGYLYLHQIVRTWAKSMLHNTGSKITVIGAEHVPKDEPVLFVSNHQANFDIPLLLGYLPKPKGFIAKVELKKFALVQRWMQAIQCVFLDRSSTRKSLEAIGQAIKTLKNGHSMIIFPEGTRSKSNKLGLFKKGSLKIAQKAGVPIMPVTINGSYKIMGTKGYCIQPAEIQIVIAPAIDPTALTSEEQENLADYVREKIAANLQ